MATVHIGRMSGPMGFSRTVAIKCLRSMPGQEGELSLMLLDEARVAARIQHPYVIPTMDVVAEQGELLVVMEYVHGESLAKLQRRSIARGERIDPALAVTIVVEVLQGLHAAHEVVDESGRALGVVHRDVSPQNVLVGADGIARVLDFGIAKAIGRAQTTREGQLKGKLAYMSPEQLLGDDVDRRTDVFAAGIVLWELLTTERLFAGPDEKATIGKLLACNVRAPGVDAGLDAIVRKALSKDPAARYATALEMAQALEVWGPGVAASRIGAWVDALSHDDLAARRLRVTEIESSKDADGRGASVETSDPTKSAQAVSVHASSPERARRTGVWVVPVLVATGVVTAGYALVLRQRPVAREAAGAEAPEPTTIPSATSAPPSGAAVPPATTSAASASAHAAASAPARATTNVHPAAVVPRAAPSASAKVDCTVPYTLDEDGRKRYKRECLHE